METQFKNCREGLIENLRQDKRAIAVFNSDIDARIAEHRAEIKKLLLQKKELKKTKMSGVWLISLLIRWLK